ncbi:hypothetical protein [Salinisphaera shabanensis]
MRRLLDGTEKTKPEGPQLPYFSNPAEAAQAWAEQYERANEATLSH